MPTDYENITPTINLRSVFTRLAGDKAHFVYELIQNADDSESQCLEMCMETDSLLVWNDGRSFTEKDVHSICSVGSSNKDLTQIGNFGIGFKAVYNYTDLPEIYSGEERFRIRELTNPEGIDGVDSWIQRLVDEGKTVFRLPFKDGADLALLRDRLGDLQKRALLFLRHLKTVRWYDDCNGREGSYSRHSHPHGTVQNASQVELNVSINGESQPPEKFLVFHKAVKPPQTVINEVLLQAEDDEERGRIERESDKQQPIEVAFGLTDGRITSMDRCKLFAYLPTDKETHLRFVIQARYQTTPARDNIPTDSPWNEWLVQETANFLPDILEQLKAGDLLDPTFFNVLPLEEDNVPAEFAPIATALQQAMKKRPLVPTEDNGYAKAENVFYPHAESLQNLVKCSCIHPNSGWLHPHIRDTEEFRRCFKVMREAGVREISVSQVLRWLEERPLDWFAGRPVEWLRALYAYLNQQKSELARIKKLPLVRLENGQHVCASDQLVFFPPNTDEAREEIAPFISELPILQSALLEIDGDEHDDMKAFLGKLGVRSLSPEKMISEWILPKYLQNGNPSVAQNRLHVRYIFKIWEKISESERVDIQSLPILRAYRGEQRESADFVAPCDAYLPEAYTGDTDLETYFSASDEDIWFVDSGYLENNDAKTWLRFLKAIGVKDTPLVIKNWPVTDATFRNFGITPERTRYPAKQTIEESYFDGLLEVLDKISNHGETAFSQVLWRILVEAFSAQRNTLFHVNYRWFYRWDQSKTSRYPTPFYRQLKEAAWLQDEQGNLRLPAECFASTPENRRLLGDSVAYLHPDFDISDGAARWLAEKLGVHLNANTESVLNYLQSLRNTEVNVEKVEPLYCFLAKENHIRREGLGQEPLIFTPTPDPRWWRADKVFWEDESPVFGNDRGYLKAHYPETLKRFFTDDLGVSERAAPLDYVRGILEVASDGRADDAEVRERVKILYLRLRPFLQEGGSWIEDEEWEQARDGKCWLGKQGDEWGFFYADELVWNNHAYLAELFKGEVPFWAFPDDLLELAKHLEVEPCSQAQVQFDTSGDQEKYADLSEKVQNLRADIQVFFESPLLCEEDKSAEVLDRVSVCLTEELTVTYTLKGTSVTEQENPRQSFLDTTGHAATLWLGLGADEDEYAELIGDALQDYFDVKELRGFVEDLLTKNRGKVLARWKQRGLRADLCASPSEPDREDAEEPTKTLEETGSEYAEPKAEPSAPQTPQTESTDSAEDESEPSTDFLPRDPEHKPNRRKKWQRRRRKGKKHCKLKTYLAKHPTLFGEGLELVDIEYTFQSKDRVDILFKDTAETPVTVEVETDQPASGIWQAVKYKHLAAVEYGIPCENVRSILAAPRIPDNVKQECERLGIEPVEVDYP
ncbi:hypothetical protein C6495_13180 [Candidatus Poribacteria bacterium]|nr:MAG: hypothetical protein C6495_13180 [Candidatus Poribacteria bacterium]